MPSKRRLRLPIAAICHLVLLLVVGLAAPMASHAAERRAAVVVGNGAYPSAPLDNPLNDARSMASVLAELHFDVLLVRDAKTADFRALLDQMTEHLQGADIGLFYYAGHAMQHQGTNLFLPVDLSARSVDEAISQSLSIYDVIDRMQAAKAKLSVLILDACRNNPFVEIDSSLAPGLGLVEPSSGEILIGYATSAGKEALDGAEAGRNSPYTAALVSALETPDWDIYEVFRQVRRQVREATNGLQLPWVSGSIENRFVIRPASYIEPVSAVESLPAAPAEDDELPVDRVLWQFIRSSNDPGDFLVFMSYFPDSGLVAEARTKLAELRTERGYRVREAGQPAPDPTDPAAAALADLNAASASVTAPEQPAGKVTLLATTGDRSPPWPLRLWPQALPQVESGLATQVTECDLMAADPDDPARIVPGVRWGLVNIRAAVRACAIALAKDAANPRLLFQFGRVLDMARSYDWAAHFYGKAARQNYAAALTNWGYMYRTGRGLEQDYGRAAELYRQAARLGNLRARTNLGSLYLQGKGVPQSSEEGLLWYRLAGADGWTNAVTALADVYRRGEHLKKDERVAVELYQAAAQMGQTDAMSNLGRAYLAGTGVPADQMQAVYWLTRATEAGNEVAPYYLSQLQAEGVGMQADQAKAAALLQLAADRGNAQGHLKLGELYETGSAGQIDLEKAYFEYRLAQEGKQAKAAERLSGLLPQLDPAAVQRAEASVQRWLEQNGL